jgi:predicted MFS family arabinose efflux permease
MVIFINSRFGRKRPYYIALLLVIVSSVSASFSPNYIVYWILQFAMGFNTVVLFATAVTLGE